VISQEKLQQEIERLLVALYQKRFKTLKKLNLKDLVNKNPYLYRAIGIPDPGDLIEQVLAARVSSSDETLFGNAFLEPLAIWAAKNSDEHEDGRRTVTVGAGAGQDIAIETATAYLAISVKSGTNILNAQSAKGQSSEFVALSARLKKLNKQFRPVIGFGYGRKRHQATSDVEKLAGQAFWRLLTGEENFYLRIAQTIGPIATAHGQPYGEAYIKTKLKLQRDFMLNFVSEDGEVMWDAIVAFNSAEKNPGKLKTSVEPDGHPKAASLSKQSSKRL
jgi:Type II restriction endonuclease EcoO109I